MDFSDAERAIEGFEAFDPYRATQKLPYVTDVRESQTGTERGLEAETNEISDNINNGNGNSNGNGNLKGKKREKVGKKERHPSYTGTYVRIK